MTRRWTHGIVPAPGFLQEEGWRSSRLFRPSCRRSRSTLARRSTTLLRTFGSEILTKARLSSRPSRLLRNSRMKASEVSFSHSGGRASVGVRCFLEEELDRDIEDLRYLEQPARADAVHTLLVFLHLLKREPHALAETLLAHPQKHTAQTDPAPHVLIHRVRLLACHAFTHQCHDWLNTSDAL